MPDRGPLGQYDTSGGAYAVARSKSLPAVPSNLKTTRSVTNAGIHNLHRLHVPALPLPIALLAVARRIRKSHVIVLGVADFADKWDDGVGHGGGLSGQNLVPVQDHPSSNI